MLGLRVDRAQSDELFDTFDEDGSGTVDCAELGNVMKSLGQKMTDEEIVTHIEGHHRAMRGAASSEPEGKV